SYFVKIEMSLVSSLADYGHEESPATAPRESVHEGDLIDTRFDEDGRDTLSIAPGTAGGSGPHASRRATPSTRPYGRAIFPLQCTIAEAPGAKRSRFVAQRSGSGGR